MSLHPSFLGINLNLPLIIQCLSWFSVQFYVFRRLSLRTAGWRPLHQLTDNRMWKSQVVYVHSPCSEFGVLLAADRQSTSSSWYRASLWGPWPDLYFSSFLDWQFFFFLWHPLMRKLYTTHLCMYSYVCTYLPSIYYLPTYVCMYL
jgi:hypothetical protein